MNFPRRKPCRKSSIGCRRPCFHAISDQPSLTEEGVDYFVGRTLYCALRSLVEQIYRELLLTSRLPRKTAQLEQMAYKISSAFRGQSA